MPADVLRDREGDFQDWYAGQSSRLGLSPDPDDPQHFYDWRAAYRAGATPNAEGHWPSQFKLEGHPRMVVDGVNTKTGQPGFADLASRISQTDLDLQAARKKREQAQAEQQAAIEKAKAGTQPERDAITARAKEPMPTPVEPMVAPPPPSRGLHDFLAPTPGESPENTITKLIQGVTLLATGFTGLARKDATSALASMKGALQGWQEGDKQRADRAFSDWKAQMDKLIVEHQSRVDTYKELIANRKLSGDELMRALEIKSAEYGHDLLAAKVKTGDAQQVIAELTQQQNHLDALQRDANHLAAMHQNKEEQREFLREFWKEKQREKAKDSASVVPNDPQVLEAEGKSWFTDPNYKPPSGLRGDGARMYHMAVRKAGLDWAKAHGIDPMSSTTVRAEVKAARENLTKITRDTGTQEAAMRRFENHAKLLKELSDKWDRSDAPAVNAAILRGDRDFKGSEIAAALVFQSFEVASEFAKIMVPGGSTGDAASREEARKAFAAELSKGQMRRVVEQAELNAHNSMRSNEESRRLAQQTIDTLGGRLEAPPIPPPPSSMDANDPLGILGKKNG